MKLLIEVQRQVQLRSASSTVLLERTQRLRRTGRRLFSASERPLKLFQYQICPFCNIVKSTLDFVKVPFETIEVNPLTKAELSSEPLSGEYKKVPVALIDGVEQINGSDEIIQRVMDMPRTVSFLEANGLHGERFQDSEWRTFAAVDLAQLLYPNICGSLGDSYRAFGYVNNVDSFSRMQQISVQYLGMLAMYMAAAKVKKRIGITDERTALSEALGRFERDGLQGGRLQFSSGLDKPDLGDLAVFGVLRSVRGLDAHDFAIKSRPGPLKDWYAKMVGETR
mmetsp:Transcript_23890/g.54236  ORF Transcript_23890/g.54236 Transcript_23890/m.54236 type:complete len:281 (-) Transcript_23890:63-905(-)